MTQAAAGLPARERVADRPVTAQERTAARVATRQVIRDAIGIWIGTRIALTALTYFSLNLNHPDAGVRAGMLLSWRKWDGDWYYIISTVGYQRPEAPNFFPLYPAAVGVVYRLFGSQQWNLVAISVSSLGALVGFIGVGLLAYHETRDRWIARLAVLLLASFPFAYYLYAPFSESFFLAAVSLCLLAARRRAWRWACLAAGLAVLTRPTGFLVALPLAWEWADQHGWFAAGFWRRLTPRSVAGLGGVLLTFPLAYSIFGLVIRARYGDFFLPFKTHQLYWNTRFMTPWSALALEWQHFSAVGVMTEARAIDGIDMAVMVLFVVITLAAVRIVPVSFTIYSLATLLVLFSSPVPSAVNDIYLGVGRYLLVLVPTFLAVAIWLRRRPGLEFTVLATGLLLQAALVARFFSDRWLT